MLEPLLEWLESLLGNLLIQIIRGICMGVWYVEKAIGWLADQVISSQAWESIINTMTSNLSLIMPDTIEQIVFGAGGGLFYLAIGLLGLALSIPILFKNSQKLVAEVPRVLGWTAFMLVLFVSSTAGYDAISLIETARLDAIQHLSNGWNQTRVSYLLASPMSASPDDLTIDSFQLPPAFEALYFPDPTAFETRTITFYDAPLIGTLESTITIETPESRETRAQQASLAILLTTLNIIPTGVVAMLGFIFLALTATAFVLILFTVISLPLGLFEVGMAVLSQVASRYLLVWFLSLFAAIFPGVLLGISELTLTPPITLQGLFLYTAILLVAAYAVYHVSRWVGNVALDSFAVIGQAINTALIQMGASATIAPAPQQLPPTYALGAVGAAVGAYGMSQASLMPLMGIASTFAPEPTTTTETQTHTEPAPHVFSYLEALPAETVIEGEWEPVPLLDEVMPLALPMEVSDETA